MISHDIPFLDLLGIAATSQVKSRQIGSKMGSLQAVLTARWRAPGGFGNQGSDWPARTKQGLEVKWNYFYPHLRIALIKKGAYPCRLLFAQCWSAGAIHCSYSNHSPSHVLRGAASSVLSRLLTLLTVWTACRVKSPPCKPCYRAHKK